MSAPSSALHERLKLETDTAHRTLEKSLNLMRPDLSLSDYILLLKAFYGFYYPLEEFLGTKTKTNWLHEDLAHFKINPETLPLCQKIPSKDDESYKIGIHYVLEGSNLGAMVLTRHFEKTLRLSSNSGLRFFSGHGSHTLENWKAFLSRMQTFSESKYCNKDYVIAGANDTFSLLYTWLIYYK